MPLSAQSLSRAIEGLWRDRSNDVSRLPGTLRFAPMIRQTGNGEYQIATSDYRLDQRDSRIGGVKSDLDQYPDGDFGYSAVSVSPKRRLAQRFRIPQRTIDSLEGANAALDIADDAMKAVANQILTQHVLDTITAATDGSTGYIAGSGLDLSDQSTDIVDFFDTEIEAVQLTSTKRPNAVLMSPAALRAFRRMDALQAATAIAAGGSTDDFRRTGTVPVSSVEAWFADFGLELIVEEMSLINTAGTAAYAMGTNLFLGFVDPRGGSAHTFVQTLGRSAEMIDFDVQDMRHPDPRGLSVAGDAMYDVQITDREAGRRIALTL